MTGFKFIILDNCLQFLIQVQARKPSYIYVQNIFIPIRDRGRFSHKNWNTGTAFANGNSSGYICKLRPMIIKQTECENH